GRSPRAGRRRLPDDGPGQAHRVGPLRDRRPGLPHHRRDAVHLLHHQRHRRRLHRLRRHQDGPGPGQGGPLAAVGHLGAVPGVLRDRPDRAAARRQVAAGRTTSGAHSEGVRRRAAPGGKGAARPFRRRSVRSGSLASRTFLSSAGQRVAEPGPSAAPRGPQSLSAASMAALATGAARPLPLTSERAASDCSTITATATSLPVESDFAYEVNQAYGVLLLFSPCCAVPVLPPTVAPGIRALPPVPSSTTVRIADWSCCAVPELTIRSVRAS